MTDNEIIKSMQCVIGNEMLCSECTYEKVLPFPSCRMMCAKNALDLINRQKAEIERLNIESETLATQLKGVYEQIHKLNMAKSEAIKEFAERLKRTSIGLEIGDDKKFKMTVVSIVAIDNLVKEMTEVNEE